MRSIPCNATLFNPLGAGFRWAVTVPGTSAGDVVAVLGPGVRGLSACAAAKEAGAGFVMVTGRGARDANRLAVAREFGADLAVDVETTDPVRALRDATGQRADVVIDVTAKAPAALGQAVQLARAGGTIVVAGTRAQAGRRRASIPTRSSTRSSGCSGHSASTPPPTRRRSSSSRPAGSRSRSSRAAVVGLDGAASLLAAMAGEGDTPPLHAVIVPR